VNTNFIKGTSLNFSKQTKQEDKVIKSKAHLEKTKVFSAAVASKKR